MTALDLPAASLDAVVAFVLADARARGRPAGPPRAIHRWLRPGGVLVATMGAQDAPDDVEDDWLGAPMFFSHYGAKQNRALVRAAGFEIEMASSRRSPRTGTTPCSCGSSPASPRSRSRWLSGRARHPGPAAVAVPAAIREAIVAQARAEYPNEACGVIVGDAPAAEGGAALHYVATRNEARRRSATRSTRSSSCTSTIEIDDADQVFWGIVHSHTHTPGRAVADRHRLPRSTSSRCTCSSRSSDDRGGSGHGRAEPARLAHRRRRDPRGRGRARRAWRPSPSRDAPRTRADRRARPGRRSRSSAARRRLRTPTCSTPLVSPPRDHPGRPGRWIGRGRVILLSRGLGRLAGRRRRTTSRAWSAASGWSSSRSPRSPPRPAGCSAKPLPLIVALVIAGIDVIETSFLLLVVGSGAVNRRG